MQKGIKTACVFCLSILTASLSVTTGCNEMSNDWQWETLTTTGQPEARHEAGLISYKGKIYLLGGRGLKPTSVFDPQNNQWKNKATPPLEIHHFQPVVYGNAIYIIGAMTGPWPNEEPLTNILIYYPEKDEFEFGDSIPTHRRRGGAGVVTYNNKIYMVGGITDGHMTGARSWFDEYDPATGQWNTLDNAPMARDHFQAVVVKDRLFTFAGRTTSKATDEDISLTVSHGNVYDFETGKWLPTREFLKIPTKRAGNSAFSWNGQIIMGGGESAAQEVAHSEVEVFDSDDNKWIIWPSLKRGRHGTGFAQVGDYLYTASGCGNRGGEPELFSIERLKLPKKKPICPTSEKEVDSKLIYSQRNTITLAFDGPNTSESAEINPFTNYVLSVNFRYETGKEYKIRGFYAADGNAAHTSASEGSIWQVRFTPEEIGQWTYKASFVQGVDIAMKQNSTAVDTIPLDNPYGSFEVVPTQKKGQELKALGRLIADEGRFKFVNSEQYFLKVGANSPENFLAYKGFDNTYRIKASSREGEAKSNSTIHQYKPHFTDWNTGDPTWGKDEGKEIIGAANYLAKKGMNSVYFLTLNITGDGNDVWPYKTHDDFSRFDVSKLEQWEILFEHMQSKGILLHVVLQETENETLLDNGNTGNMRRLYFNELIARFGHHLALVWNLGEENGPAPWSPVGQNDDQRRQMAKFLKLNDPYDHPVLLHTHAYDPLRKDILDSLLGFPYIDGISLQQDKREHVNEIVTHWKSESKKASHPWVVSMDEIGMWFEGALTDSADQNHPTLTSHVLWGSLLSGGDGVEWYFGAKHPHNDLTSEDWGQRDRLWEITSNAQTFFEKYLPWWEMEPAPQLIKTTGGHCLRKSDELYTIYLPQSGPATLDLTEANHSFSVEWYNPFKGGELMQGKIKIVKGGAIVDLGQPPGDSNHDWVILLRKI